MTKLMTFILLVVLIGCNSRDPKIFLDKSTCAAPCWYELIPGQSTIDESQAILESLPFVWSSSIKTTAYGQETATSWRFSGDATGYGGLIHDGEGALKIIRFNPIGLTLGEAIDTLGNPGTVLAYYTVSEIIEYELLLYYPTRGITISTFGSPKDAPYETPQRITQEMTVSNIEFYAASDLRTILIEIEQRSPENADYILSLLQPWPGFGEDAIRVAQD